MYFISLLCSKVTVSVRYAELVSTLPSRARVLAWPIHPTKKISILGENGGSHVNSSPSRLTYAEEALTTMSLPEGTVKCFFLECANISMLINSSYVTVIFLYAAYAEIVLNLQRAIRQVYPYIPRD